MNRASAFFDSTFRFHNRYAAPNRAFEHIFEGDDLSSRFQQCFFVGLIAMGIFAIIRHRIIAGEAGHCLRKPKEAI